MYVIINLSKVTECTMSSMKVKVTQLCPTLCDPYISMEFSRPEYWSGQPFPSPGDLPNPGIKPKSSTFQVDSLPAEPQNKPIKYESKVIYGCWLVMCQYRLILGKKKKNTILLILLLIMQESIYVWEQVIFEKYL